MLTIDLTGKKAFIAGVGDDQGFGWAIAKMLAAAGATVYVGTWPPVHKIFTQALANGKFDASRKLPDGSMMEFADIFPLDAAFDSMDEVPQEIKENKRYKDQGDFTISAVAEAFAKKHGKVDVLIHALANAPEVKNPLLQTTRNGYLAAMSASSYSFVSLLRHFGPHFTAEGSALTLSYLAALRTVPGYGGGMSSAKAALESDTRTLAFEAGREWGIRVNAISAGPLRSRAARAIGSIDRMIEFAGENSPLVKGLSAEEIANASAFLSSSLATGITGVTLYVDNGYHSMGIPAPAVPILAN